MLQLFSKNQYIHVHAFPTEGPGYFNILMYENLLSNTYLFSRKLNHLFYYAWTYMNCVTDINLYTTDENISHVTNNKWKISLTMFYYIDSNTMYKVKQKQDDQILKCQIMVVYFWSFCFVHSKTPTHYMYIHSVIYCDMKKTQVHLWLY